MVAAGALLTTRTFVGPELTTDRDDNELVIGTSDIGPSRHFAAAHQPRSFWGKADIKWQAGSIGSVANDPDRTLTPMSSRALEVGQYRPTLSGEVLHFVCGLGGRPCNLNSASGALSGS
jgi:hypothetical protein